MTQRNNQAEDTPTADEKKRDVVKVHKDLDIRPPKSFRENWAKQFKAGDKVEFELISNDASSVTLKISKSTE